jgi:Raf kinase inhibitor-like YbhB/YbcL family protein
MPLVLLAGTIVGKPKAERFPAKGRPHCEVRVKCGFAAQDDSRWPEDRSEEETAMKTLSIVAITAFAFLGLANFASAQGVFQVSSMTFRNNEKLPISAIFTRIEITPKNTRGNACEPAFKFNGGNRSPELSWTNVPPKTASFVVIASDTTVGVTHWGMYNIPRTTTMLPENAGVPENAFQQILNVYDALGYGGPCPPRNVPPLVHDYKFEVFALDQQLTLPPNANDEQLLSALADAGAGGHELARASITGRWSSTPGALP